MKTDLWNSYETNILYVLFLLLAALAVDDLQWVACWFASPAVCQTAVGGLFGSTAVGASGVALHKVSKIMIGSRQTSTGGCGRRANDLLRWRVTVTRCLCASSRNFHFDHDGGRLASQFELSLLCKLAWPSEWPQLSWGKLSPSPWAARHGPHDHQRQNTVFHMWFHYYL